MLQDSVAAQRFLAMSAPDEKRDSAMARVEAEAAAIPAKRAYTKSPASELEGPVVAAIADVLAMHPRVLFAVRQNSGSMQYMNSGGHATPVWFHRIVRMPKEIKVRMTDFWGFALTSNGHPYPFAIEAKRPSWKAPLNEREVEQAAYLGFIRGIGGIGIFATSADQVAQALSSA